MKIFFGFIFLPCFFCSFGAFSQEKEMYVIITDIKPEIGVETEVYLGDRMLSQRRRQWRECITPLRAFKRVGNWGAAQVAHKEGEPLCKRSANDKTDRYWPNYINWLGNGELSAQVRWTPKKNKSKLCICQGAFCNHCVKNIDESEMKKANLFVYAPNSSQQVIEYIGNSDNLLTFTYGEFADGDLRETVNREFQVDLNK